MDWVVLFDGVEVGFEGGALGAREACVFEVGVDEGGELGGDELGVGAGSFGWAEDEEEAEA